MIFRKISKPVKVVVFYFVYITKNRMFTLVDHWIYAKTMKTLLTRVSAFFLLCYLSIFEVVSFFMYVCVYVSETFISFVFVTGNTAFSLSQKQRKKETHWTF